MCKGCVFFYLDREYGWVWNTSTSAQWFWEGDLRTTTYREKKQCKYKYCSQLPDKVHLLWLWLIKTRVKPIHDLGYIPAVTSWLPPPYNHHHPVPYSPSFTRLPKGVGVWERRGAETARAGGMWRGTREPNRASSPPLFKCRACLSTSSVGKVTL